jgi:hypothetical protein
MFGYLYICFIWLVIEVIGHFNYISICLLLQVKLISFPFAAFSIIVKSTISVIKFAKTCPRLARKIDQTINLISVSNFSCIEDSTLQFSINLSN